MMHDWLSSPYFGLTISVVFFVVGSWLFQRIRIPLFMPLVFSIIGIIFFLMVFQIPYDQFNIGGQYIGIWITPATIALAIGMEKNWHYLEMYLKEIVIGIACGVIFHTVLIFLFCLLFKFQLQFVATLIPKPITTPIAMGVAEALGGMVPLTVAIVVFTGVVGAIIGPTVMKVCHIEHPVAQGIAMGAASHAMGTAKAIEIGEVQGAMSGLAIVITGLMIIVISPIAHIIILWLF